MRGQFRRNARVASGYQSYSSNEQKMRVLLVSHGHPSLSAGGAEIASYALFEGLKSAPGLKPFYLAWADRSLPSISSRIAPFLGRADEFVFYSSEYDRFSFSQCSREVLDGYKRLLVKLNPEVIHIHHYVNVGLELISIAREVNRGVRIILTLHEYHAICHHGGVMMKTGSALSSCLRASPEDCVRCFPNRLKKEFVDRKTHILKHFNKVDLFVAPSHFLRQRYIEWGVPPWQIVTIENGIAAPGSASARTEEGLRRAPNRFAYFGQIHPYKGLLQLLAAFERLATVSDRGQSPYLTIHGADLESNAPDYVRLFRAALVRCGSSVRFAGPYERSRQGELAAQADWIVVPSIWWENSPLVIEEALANRRPVICSDIGGMAEKVRPGLDGFHFPVGDSRSLAALISRVACDREAWIKLQNTLRRPTSIDEAILAHIEIYSDRSFSFV